MDGRIDRHLPLLFLFLFFVLSVLCDVINFLLIRTQISPELLFLQQGLDVLLVIFRVVLLLLLNLLDQGLLLNLKLFGFSHSLVMEVCLAYGLRLHLFSFQKVLHFVDLVAFSFDTGIHPLLCYLDSQFLNKTVVFHPFFCRINDERCVA